ncbi:hypothetical protein PUN28_003402 [Cardiocondyla obscurior]|uniref:Uncharacterized protein n=1 Tax=Cardiocondyla obscurior TaxID=286306 RepID=A0AAW2GM12_9HYME
MEFSAPPVTAAQRAARAAYLTLAVFKLLLYADGNPEKPNVVLSSPIFDEQTAAGSSGSFGKAIQSRANSVQHPGLSRIYLQRKSSPIFDIWREGSFEEYSPSIGGIIAK